MISLQQALQHLYIASCHKGDTKVSSCNVIGHDSYDELVSRLASVNIALENEMAKTSKLESEN